MSEIEHVRINRHEKRGVRHDDLVLDRIDRLQYPLGWIVRYEVLQTVQHDHDVLPPLKELYYCML
ncbi:MAG: hypothetical protein ABSB83_04210 [Methanomassiliicoccales archaeon]